MQAHRTTTDIENLVNEIQLEITEAPYDAIVHYVRRSIVEFCERSHYWQEDVGPVRVNSLASEYDLPVSRRVAICSVIRIFYVENEEEKDLPRCETTDVKYRFWQETPFTFSPYPLDELEGIDLSVVVALKPELYNNSFAFSEFLLIDFRDAIVAGAKSNLYKIPRKPWADLQQAQINGQIFNAAVIDALRRQARGFSTLPDRAVRKARTFY